MKNWFSEENIHRIFDISLILKGLHSFFEIAGGILVLLVSQQFVINFVTTITQEELSEDPKDLIAHYLITSAQNFSINMQHFLGLYLLLHGIIKGLLIIGLFKEKLWAYPLSIVVFSLFGAYQIFEFTRTYSVWLLALTVLDIIIIALTWHEYRYMRKTGLKLKW